MKKIFRFLFLALLSGAIISISCTREELNPENIPSENNVGKGDVRLTLNTGSPDVRTYMEVEDGHYVPKWNSSDKLGVFFDNFAAGASALEAALENETGEGEIATFSGTASLAAGTHTMFAFYPSRAFYATYANKVIGLEIPYIQFPTADSFDPRADLLVSVPYELELEGTTDESVEINDMKFKRVGCILKVNLTDETGLLGSDKVRSVTISSSMSGAALSGEFKYDFVNEDAVSGTYMSGAKNYVTADLTRLNSNSGIDFGDPVYIVIPPSTLASGSNLTFTVKTNNHEAVKAVSLTSDYPFVSSKVKNVNVKIDATAEIEHVYYQDNFDWLNYWYDSIHETANARAAVITDPVSAVVTSHDQPNIMSNALVNTIGADFLARGYIDKAQDNKTIYMQENYIKIGASGKQTGIQLPPIDFGSTPTNVTISFKWCRHMQTSGGIDTVPLIVEVLNHGVCADSGTSISNVLTTPQSNNEMFWTTSMVNLCGVTSDTRIVIRENYSSYTQSSTHRFHLDDIKITEMVATPVVFPVQWFVTPGAGWVSGVDYFMNTGSVSGSYVYSVGYKGKLSVTRTSSKAVEDNGTPKTPTCLSRHDIKDTDGVTEIDDQVMFLHYGIGKGSYWQFDVYNVKNTAGTYGISFKMCSSGSGARHFRLEQKLDDGPWTPFGTQLSTMDTDGTTTIYYNYEVTATNVAVQAQGSFHLDAMDSFHTLSIRAIVASEYRCSGSAGLSPNTTATNRVLGSPTITFTPD